MVKTKSRTRFVLCINNGGHPVSLEVRKIYRTLPDEQATAHRLVRVIDESGEDYLYPEDFFVPIDVPTKATQVFAEAR